jgi:heme oxygenase
MQTTTQATLPEDTEDIRSWLKLATKAEHEALHHQKLLLALHEGTIDLIDYQQVLRSFLVTYTTAQQACRSARSRHLTKLPAIIDVDEHIRLLSKDLTYCAQMTQTEDKQRDCSLQSFLPQALAKLVAQSLWQQTQRGTLSAWLLGQFYSLHGSRFGRGILFKGAGHLFNMADSNTMLKHPDCSAHETKQIMTARPCTLGRTFLSLKASAETCSWPTFCDILNQTVVTRDQRNACHTGASLSFKLLGALLNLNPAHQEFNETHAM